VSRTPDWPKPRDVLEYFDESLEIIESIPAAFPAGVPASSRYRDVSVEDVRIIAGKLKTELELQCVMSLAASIEATFQVDLRTRVRNRLNNDASNRLRRLWKQTRTMRRRIEFEQILEAWKKSIAGITRATGSLKQVLEFRHWIAHGRYWQQKSGLANLGPLEVWSRWEDVRDRIASVTEFPLE